MLTQSKHVEDKKVPHRPLISLPLQCWIRPFPVKQNATKHPSANIIAK